jgi:hypothetical protein
MDIYSQASLISNSTTFVNVGNKKVKGILVSNLGATGQANIHVYSATGGNTLQSVLGIPASSTFILPIKVTGASTSSGLISVYGLY